MDCPFPPILARFNGLESIPFLSVSRVSLMSCRQISCTVLPNPTRARIGPAEIGLKFGPDFKNFRAESGHPFGPKIKLDSILKFEVSPDMFKIWTEVRSNFGLARCPLDYSGLVPGNKLWIGTVLATLDSLVNHL